MNKKLEQAREWASGIEHLVKVIHPDAKAAIEIIQSLPDQLVDAEKLKAIIADMDHCLKMESTTDFSRGIDNATTSWRDALKALVTPKLPTLADMTEAEREACQWMQAVRRDERCVITRVYANTVKPTVRLLTSDGTTLWVNADEVTPLPDLPKLQWPSGIPQKPYRFGGTSAESDLPFP